MTTDAMTPYAALLLRVSLGVKNDDLAGQQPDKTPLGEPGSSEDQLGDAERSHTTEQVAYVTFAGTLRYSD